MYFRLLPFLLLISVTKVTGQFAPPAGQKGTSAMHKDSSAFKGWAKSCKVIRGFQDISDPSLGYASAGDSSMALGKAGLNGTVSLGDEGIATLYFEHPITNGPGYDFAVFENSFDEKFLELAHVEVSSDGINYSRFKSTSLSDTTTQKAGFDYTDATKINNLAGKYKALFGTPFDLDELKDVAGLNINNIISIKIIDVVGSLKNEYSTKDGEGRKINDPWPTPFPSSGFDLDAVGVINYSMTNGVESDEYSSLNIYPNPVKTGENIYINFFSNNITIEIYGVDGKLSLEEKIDRSERLIRTDKLLKGVYFVKIKSDSKIIIKKLVITE